MYQPQLPITNPEPLLPHSGHMVLLDTIQQYDAQSLHATATIHTNHILLPLKQTALPIWLGSEILAQGIGAWAGIQAKQQGKEIQLGFLLGSRKLHFFYDDIPVGTELNIYITQSYQDNTGMGVFDCLLSCRQPAPNHEHKMPVNSHLIQGNLTVFSPTNHNQLQNILSADN